MLQEEASAANSWSLMKNGFQCPIPEKETSVQSFSWLLVLFIILPQGEISGGRFSGFRDDEERLSFSTYLANELFIWI
jgi:hypothetical protein